MLPQKRTNLNKKHPLYWIWNSMHIRCYYKSHKQYKDYGGRGISVQDSWFDFENFVRDIETYIGKRPTRTHTLDRKYNDERYWYGNVRWATPKQQNRNRRC